MQEDKESVFDSIDTVKICLKTIKPMLETMTVNKDKMLKASKEGFINATDCADYLTKKGVPFRDAYKITGGIVKYAIDNKKTLDTLEIEEYKNFSNEFEEDIYDAIDLITCVEKRKVVGGPAPEVVKKEIKKAKETIKKD